MAKPIQIIPPGLWGMMQLKNAGKLPDTLLETVQPTFDLREWYTAANREIDVGTLVLPVGVSAGSNVLPFRIPDDQWWYVWNHSLTLILDAGDSINGQLTVNNSAPAFVSVLAASPQLVATGLAIQSFWRVAAEPRRWFGPGTDMSCGYSNVTSATSSLFQSVEYTRCYS